MSEFLQENRDITKLSNYKTPARTRYLFELNSESLLSELTGIYHFALQNNLPILVISWGTNMLFAFDIFDGIIIHNQLLWWSYDRDTQLLNAYSWELIWDIAESLEYNYNQDIWHRFIWLPWSIWWAVYWNAWCFWLETSWSFVSCDVYNRHTWQRSTLYYDEMHFWYRYSILKEKNHLFLVSATFDLWDVREKYSSNVDNIHFRKHLQPLWHSCWSFFKNPTIDRDEFLKKYPNLSSVCPKNISAGFLIEQVWLKWFSHWGAFFSELHSNFLMHNGQWKWTDLLYLIKLAQTEVHKKFGVTLVNEVQIIYSQ